MYCTSILHWFVLVETRLNCNDDQLRVYTTTHRCIPCAHTLNNRSCCTMCSNMTREWEFLFHRHHKVTLKQLHHFTNMGDTTNHVTKRQIDGLQTCTRGSQNHRHSASVCTSTSQRDLETIRTHHKTNGIIVEKNCFRRLVLPLVLIVDIVRKQTFKHRKPRMLSLVESMCRSRRGILEDTSAGSGGACKRQNIPKPTDGKIQWNHF